MAIASKDTLAAFTSGSQRLQFLATVIITYQIFATGSYWQSAQQVASIWAKAEPLVVAVPAFAFLNAISAIFKVIKGEKELGRWLGRRFVYHSPANVLTVLVTEADNDKAHIFKVRGVAPQSLVEVLIDIDRRDDRVKAQVARPHVGPIIEWAGWHKGIRTSLRLALDGRMGLLTNAAPNTDATTIRVAIGSWEL